MENCCQWLNVIAPGSGTEWARDWGVMTEEGCAPGYCHADGFFRSVTKGFGDCIVRRWGKLKLVDGKVRLTPAPGWVAGRWRNQEIREGFWQRVRKETLDLGKKTNQTKTLATSNQENNNQKTPKTNPSPPCICISARADTTFLYVRFLCIYFLH